MKQGCTHIAAFFLLLLACSPLAAQVSIKLTADRDKILIGEPVSLSVDAYVPLGSEVGWFPADSIQHFNVIRRSAIDTVNNIDGKKISQVLTITSFDSGRWTIPPFEVNVAGRPYYSDSVSVDVAFLSFDPKEDYHDIKDIVVVENPALRYIPWLVLCTALVAGVLTMLFWRKFKKHPAVANQPETSRLSPYEDAMLALAGLGKRSGLQGDEKTYYSEMNDILRKYVSRKFGIATFERTNEELILQLASMKLPQKSFSGLVQALRISDFVKFAKYRPSEADNIDNLETVRSSIDVLNNYSGSAV